MFDHISIGVADLDRARTFYDAALAPLDYRRLHADDGSLGYGRNGIGLWVLKSTRPVTPDPASGLHFCIEATSAEAIRAFHAAALAAGGKDNGQPGERPDYGAGYFAAFAIDPDGYRLEAHCQVTA